MPLLNRRRRRGTGVSTMKNGQRTLTRGCISAKTALLPDSRARRRSGRTLERSWRRRDRKSTRLNSSHSQISYAVFCLKKKKNNRNQQHKTHLSLEHHV